ncbi:hypothetical protein BPAE_0073g00370 [Botrytis paeoniae]|uniref:Uncharacterized protein n=1 Tax=Botrytis paeoniae TaxID=278948 RepID=A0A4Z1FVM3_9HELO|nr:hypothetical protein BPAE_0073g00370 [Botrytis paeoniae]
MNLLPAVKVSSGETGDITVYITFEPRLAPKQSFFSPDSISGLRWKWKHSTDAPLNMASSDP